MDERPLSKPSKNQPTTNKGCKFERIALRYLRKHKLTLLDQNYRCRTGEIDLIMRDSQAIVFIEVRYRSSEQYGGALESVTPTKIKRILSATKTYLAEHQLWDKTIRFDVVAIQANKGKWLTPYNIEWIQAAFEA